MIISAIVAVALGVTPVKETSAPQIVTFDEERIAAQVGPYKRVVRRDGSTDVSGFDRSGRPYRLNIGANGHVTGQVGIWNVTFDIKDPA